jgi:hypothetical protein
LKNIHPGLVAALVILLLLPGLAFIGLRLSLPGDASAPVIDFQESKNGALVVRPLSPDPQGLQNGDIVTAIQGRAIDQHLEDLYSSQGSARPAGQIEYTVLRGERTLQLEVPLTAYPLAYLMKENWSIYIYLIYLELVSIILFILRPRLASAQLFFVVGSLIFSSGLTYFPGLRIDDLLYRWQVTLYLIGAVVLYGFILATLVHFSLMFPKPHPLLVRKPGRVLWIYLGVWLPLILYLALHWTAVASHAGRIALVVQCTTFMSAIYFPLLLLTTYSSYRTGNVREKRQLRWLLWGLMISLIPYLVFTVAPSLLGSDFHIANPLLGLLWCTVPTSFAIAVLRERLFDIDLIIRRTLIYTVLTVTLGAVYFSSILLLQWIFRVFTGQNQPPLATVLSTLMIAALFTPLRRRIQGDIDQRFYRSKYDAEKMLKVFALTVRNEVELEKLTESMLAVVKETMEPQSLSLWISKS